MRCRSALVAIFLLIAPLGGGAALAAPRFTPGGAPVQVDIPLPGSLLHAYVLKPEGSGPFPVVVAAHDCGGLQGRNNSQVRSRYREWAEQFVKAGYVVVLPDSYGSRDLGPQCRVAKSQVRASHERVTDLLASRQWVAEQAWAQHGRIALMGWGDGADALLWAVRPQAGRGADFRSAVALYPDCRAPSALGWSARVPTLVLIGGADDVNSPAACRQMVDDARGRSALAQIVIYPDAPHEFDRTGVPLQSVADKSDADMPVRGHIGSHAKSRADAQKRVVKWLAR